MGEMHIKEDYSLYLGTERRISPRFPRAYILYLGYVYQGLAGKPILIVPIRYPYGQLKDNSSLCTKLPKLVWAYFAIKVTL